MAKHPSHILEMARKGDEHRHEELNAEIAALIKTFPHLREGKASIRKSAGVKLSKELATDAPSVQKRPKWSAAAKKAVSLRMKTDWAAKRAAKTSGRAGASQRHGFGWKRWSKAWLYGTLGLFAEYRVAR